METKIKKKNDVFWPCCWGLPHCKGKGYTLMATFLENSLSVWFHFSGLVWVDKLHYFEQRICFWNNGHLGNRKKAIFQFVIAVVATGKRNFIKNMILIDTKRLTIWVDWINARWDKKSQSQKCIFSQKGYKS